MKTALICLICLIYIKWLIHDFSGEVEKDPCSNLDKLHDFSSLLPFVCGWYVEFLIDLSVRNTTKHTKKTKKFQANDLSIQKRIGFQRIKHHPLDVSISLRSASRPKWTRASGCIITIPSAQAEAEARHRCVKNCKFDAWKMKMDANCRHDSPWKSESHLDLWFFVEMNLGGFDSGPSSCMWIWMPRFSFFAKNPLQRSMKLLPASAKSKCLHSHRKFTGIFLGAPPRRPC